jgi:pimeloyl-ACP methyl ester carboxylesterase
MVDARGSLGYEAEAAVHVVFVHGACVRDGPWWWHPAAEILQARGVSSAAPPLPSCGEAGQAPGADGPGLRDDVTEVRRVLQSSDEPVTIVAHSYGGIVVAEAAAGIPAVQHLVLISSYLPEPGQSLSSFAGDEPAPFLRVNLEAGVFGVQPELFVDTFMHDCPADVVAESVLHLAEQSLSVTHQPVHASAWKQVPSTYLVCTGDRGTPPDRQRDFARRATRVIDLDSGHHPFLSHPDAVADVITTFR